MLVVGQPDNCPSIVFLHGLTGTRDGTWTANDASAPWPELLLIKDLPQARVITYGYDADVVNFWSMASQSRIAEHSQKFLTSIANLRDASGAVGLKLWCHLFDLTSDSTLARCSLWYIALEALCVRM